MEEQKPIIVTRELTKVYDTGAVPVKAVNNVQLKVYKGEFTALVGPSGSGKTTLLNLIGGLDHPTRGQVLVNNVDISKMPKSALIDFRLQHIGFVFQAYNLIPVLTARENIEFVMLLQKRSKQEREQRVKELLKEVDLLEKMNDRPAQLSGGQQQRVAVARALASKPAFILADEPTANLDSKTAGNLLDLMARLNHEEHTTFIFSTHDQRVIDRAHRIITLVDGAVANDQMVDQPVDHR